MAKKIVRIKDIEQWTQLLEDHRSKLLGGFLILPNILDNLLNDSSM